MSALLNFEVIAKEKEDVVTELALVLDGLEIGSVEEHSVPEWESQRFHVSIHLAKIAGAASNEWDCSLAQGQGSTLEAAVEKLFTETRKEHTNALADLDMLETKLRGDKS